MSVTVPPEYIKLWANSAWSSVSPVPIQDKQYSENKKKQLVQQFAQSSFICVIIKNSTTIQ